MVATVDVKESNGASVTLTTVTSVRFCTADNNAPALTNPIPIPTTGNNYSYWKSLCIQWTGIGTQISNIRHYTDTSSGWGSGVIVYRGGRVAGDATVDEGCPQASYQQAAGTAGTTGNYLNQTATGHAYYNNGTMEMVDAFTDSSGTPVLIDNTAYTTNNVSKFILLQVLVNNGATRGAKTAETFTWLYDEI